MYTQATLDASLLKVIDNINRALYNGGSLRNTFKQYVCCVGKGGCGVRGGPNSLLVMVNNSMNISMQGATAGDLVHGLRRKGVDLSMDDAGRLVQLFGHADTGRMSYSDFVRMLSAAAH